MFQTFEPVSDRSFAGKHLPLLRAQMKTQNLDGFIVPHDDEYQNEYIPAYAERLMWVSGFSGSAGSAIIMQESAVVFTDGRYTLQLRQQADDAFFSYEDSTATTHQAWLEANAKPNTRIGYDPMLHTINSVRALEAATKKVGFELVPVSTNPIDAAWADQPPAPVTPAVPHDLHYAGKASAEKRKEIGDALAQNGADAVILTTPPSIAWLLNIRGGDVARTPLPLSRAILESSGAVKLFIAAEKVGNDLPAFLGDDVDIQGEEQIDSAVEQLGADKARVAFDPALTPAKYVAALKEHGATLVAMNDPCAVPRAAKNATEIEGARQAHIRDGAAVTQYLHWLATEAQSGEIDEINAAQKLEAFRAAYHDLRDLSFDSISGAGANGAICHYRVSTETNAKLALGTLFLIDSGAQYPDGTTDITRTEPIGAPSDEMRDRFTRVLKGHIALARLKFPKGTTGHQIDAIARQPLWEAGLDYDHGTGHGVGSFLGVHEGPQRISKAPNAQPLLPGMILSNEPGFYKEGEYGIRIENLIVVTETAPIDGADREMLEFETITLAPINLDMIKTDLLSEDERLWLNDYHTMVRSRIGALIPAEMSDWFAQATRPL